MKHYNINDFIKGWFIGDFDKSIIRTNLFEIAIKQYQAGDKEQKHIHYIAKEITVIIFGTVRMNGNLYSGGDIIEIHPGEGTDFECLTNVTTCCVKMPSLPKDKYDMD